jgi:hypothetical protein
MSKRKLDALKKKLEDVQLSKAEMEQQVKMVKSQAYDRRSQRYEFMRKDFQKNREEIFKLDREEKDLWLQVSSMNDFIDEIDKDIEIQKNHLIEEATKLKLEEKENVEKELEKIQNELLKAKLEYLKHTHEKFTKASDVKNSLEQYDEFIKECGGKPREILLRNDVKLSYGRYTSSYMLSNDDIEGIVTPYRPSRATRGGRVTEGYGNPKYALFREFGEWEEDSNKAQLRLQELRKKGSK